MRGHGTRSHGIRSTANQSRYFLDDLKREPGVNVLLALDLERSQRNQGPVVQARRADAATLDFAPHELAGSLPAWSGADAWSPLAFDLSGNNNHAVQTTAGSQPKLVTSGSYVGGVEFGVTESMNGTAGLNFGLSDFCLGFAAKIKRGSRVLRSHPVVSGQNRILVQIYASGSVSLFVVGTTTIIMEVVPNNPFPDDTMCRCFLSCDRDGLVAVAWRSASATGTGQIAAGNASVNIGAGNTGLYNIMDEAPSIGTIRSLYAMTGIPSQANIDRFLNLPIPD
jgi:hypothetical protein